CQHCYGTPYSF
nr:immunoglobulin light chain junction region [Macaca mulatta]